MSHQHATLEDTVYFSFGANDTSGSGNDGATPASHVRLNGAAASAAPVISPTPVLLTNAAYPDGAYEIAVAATTGNGFIAGNTYSVFQTLLVDAQNPTGFAGSFKLGPVPADIIAVTGNTTAAGNFMGSALALGLGVVDTAVELSTITTFQTASTNFLSPDPNHYRGQIVKFYDSTNLLFLEACRITASELNGAQGKFTVTELTRAPADGALFVVG